LHPTLSLDALVGHAERMYIWLLAHGWQSLPDGGERSDER
jgi:hypothetical protein